MTKRYVVREWSNDPYTHAQGYYFSSLRAANNFMIDIHRDLVEMNKGSFTPELNGEELDMKIHLKSGGYDIQEVK